MQPTSNVLFLFVTRKSENVVVYVCTSAAAQSGGDDHHKYAGERVLW
jgi:hypothetical protein